VGQFEDPALAGTRTSGGNLVRRLDQNWEVRVSFWRTSNDDIRWLVVLGLMQLLSTATDLYLYGAGNLHWIASLSLAVACLAAAPLEEPSRKGLPWQQQLRTPNGLLAGVAFVVFLGLLLWRVIHG
jgi:hypothetical protein